MKTAYDLIWLAGERTPGHPALVDDRTDRQFTYRELLTEVDVIAAGLLQRGVRAGSRVATILPNVLEHALALIALQRIGAIPALMNARLKSAELAQLMEQGQIEGAISRLDDDLLAAIKATLPESALLLSVGGKTTISEDFADCRGEVGRLPPPPRPEPEDTAFIFYTSGTTGLPKGVVIPHRTSEHRILWLSTQAGLRHGTQNRTLGMLPLSHAIGFYGTFLAMLAQNGTFYTMSAFDPVKAVDMIETRKINYLFSVPTLFQAMRSAPNYVASRMASLELVLYGGAAITPELLNCLDKEWPATIRHIYGTTETMCSLYNPDPVGQHLTLRPGFYSNVRVINIGGSAKDVVGVGEAGELIVDATADTIFSGYLNRPDATAEKLKGGWYHTGDICLRRDDGDYDLVGRVDDVIRTGGESVYPEEVENVLITFPDIKEASVIAAPDPRWGEMVAACVVMNGSRFDLDAIDAHFRASSLASYKRPRGYLVLKEFPRNAANKVLRKSLREMFETELKVSDSDSLHYVK